MKLYLLAACALALAFAVPALHAQDVNIPGDYPTIQQGIDNVGPGGTVFVAPGTYSEALLIDPGNAYGSGIHGQATMTIAATLPGVVIQIPASPRVLDPNLVRITLSQLDSALVARGVTSLTLTGLTFDGNDDMMGGSNTFTGAYCRDGSFTVTDCKFTKWQDNPSSGAQNGVGLYAEGLTTTLNGSGCSFTEIQKTLAVISNGAQGNFTDCTFTGRGPTGSIAQNGIQWSYGGFGTADSCVIEGIWWTGGYWTSSGILGYEVGTPVVVSNCTLRDCQTSLYMQGDGTAAVNITLTGNTVTHFTDAADGYDGVDAYLLGPGSLWSVTNNSFNNVGGNGVWTDSEGGTVSGNYFNNCGATFGWANAQDDSPPVDAGNDWDGNAWSDFAFNNGYPLTYEVPGTANAVDNAPSGECPQFDNASYASDTGPADVILVDVDGDTDLDCVTANATAATLTTWTNDGAGVLTFFGNDALTAGDEPRALVSGELGGTVGLDYGVACAGAAMVRIVDAASGLVTASIPTPASRPNSLAAADLNGSGPDDMVVGMEGDLFSIGGLARILDGGAATLLPAPPGGFGTVMGVAAADLDGDLDLDVVAVMKAAVFGPVLVDNVLLYENDGSGGFTYLGALQASSDPAGVVCDDLDGDGDQDIVVSINPFPASSAGGIEVFLGDGTGSFTLAGFRDAGLFPNRLNAADLRDDGIPGFYSRRDIVAVNGGSSNISSYLGYDGADFSAIDTCSAELNPTATAIGDMNGDYTPDIVVSNFGSNTVLVMLAVPQAIAQKYGTGCPGTGGLVPQLDPVGLPQFGNPTFSVALSNARPFSLALFGVSLGVDNVTLGGGCSLFLADPILLFNLYTNYLGQATFTFVMPNDVPPFTGLNAYFQAAVFDPEGSVALLAFSNGVRIKFGE